MKTVVTGGTGFIGRALVAALDARGDEVVVLTRSSARREGRIRFEPWTPAVDGPWLQHLQGADAVINLAGQGLFDARWSAEYLALCTQSRVEPTAHLARALAALSKPPQVFVSASAVGYYGMSRGSAQLSESDAPGDDVISNLAVAWEAAAEPARAAGIRVCHPRIGLVLGAEGGALAKMLPPFRAFVGGPLGDGKQAFPWVHLADAVAALVYATTASELTGAFNLTAPAPVTMNEFARALGAALGRPVLFRVPAFALRLALGSQAEALLTGQFAIPTALRAAGFAFAHPELEPALRQLLQKS